VSELGQRAWGDRFELKVTVDGAVYLLRGTRPYLEDEDGFDGQGGKGNYEQESLYLARYQAGVWQALPATTYPTQDSVSGLISVLDGDMDLYAEGNATFAWIDNGEAWEAGDPVRLRATTILSSTTPQVTKHYYANGQRLASRVDGMLYYILGDHLGSTSLVLDAGGNEIGHIIYDAYGQIVESTIPLTLTDRLYTGQVFDASSGLYYYNARYYDPLVGQFTQPDSLVADPLDPRAWNRFSYVYGNPVNFTDPSGHCIAGLDTAVCIAVGIGVGLGTVGGHFAATSAGYEVGSPQWYGAIATGGIFGGISGGLGAAGYGLGALVLDIAADTAVDTLILGDEFGSSLARNLLFNVAFDSAGYVVGRGLGRRLSDSDYWYYRRQGFSHKQAKYLDEPYEGMGHHYPIPRRQGRKYSLPDWLIDSPLNVLKPKTSRGRFYELHYKVDKHYPGSRLPESVGGGFWSGSELGIERLSGIKRIWYATPGPLKVAIIGGIGGTAIGGGLYWYLSD
jgi:RHS repeat-associated protein